MQNGKLSWFAEAPELRQCFVLRMKKFDEDTGGIDSVKDQERRGKKARQARLTVHVRRGKNRSKLNSKKSPTLAET